MFVSFLRACERGGEARRSCARVCGVVASAAGWLAASLSSGVIAWRRGGPPRVRWVGVSQSLLVILDRGMFVGDGKGELDSLDGCSWMLLDGFLRCKAERATLGPWGPISIMFRHFVRFR